MYKVMVVDDDMLIRTNLRMMLGNRKMDIILCGEAPNGFNAVEIMKRERPDIVLSDIRMPLMDGVALSEVIKVDFPETKLIILSNYDDLDYVKATLKNGAIDYILKHTLNEEVLENAINRAKDEIKLDGRRNIDYNRFVYYNMQTLRNKFIIQLLTGVFTYDHEIRKQIDLLDIKLDSKNVIAIIMELDNYKALSSKGNLKDRSLLEYSVINIAEDILKDCESGIVAHVYDGRFVILISFEHNRSQAIIYNFTDTLIERIKGCLKKFLGISASFSVGSICESIEYVFKSYEYAEESLKSKFLLGKNKVIKETSVADEKGEFVFLDIKKEELIIQNIRKREDGQVVLIVQDVFSYIKAKKLNHTSSKMLINDLIGVINRVCKEYNIEISKVYSRENPYDSLDKLETLDEISLWVVEIFKKLMVLIEENDGCESYSDYVKNAIRFIRKNYSKDISLTDVADEININSSYLSKLFKDEVGKGFSEFIIDLRLEKAKQLLKDGEFELKEIVQVCGFNNYNYFIKIFKDRVGTTPIGYKESLKPY